MSELRDKRVPFDADAAGAFRPAAPIVNFLTRTRPTRVLDWGCGRGEVVYWLRRNGYDAVGVEVEPDYIAAGRASFEMLGLEPESIIHADELSRVERFDCVISYMVLEHIRDLDDSARRMRAALRPHGMGLHLYPGRWTPVEPHVHVPLAHWTGGRSRRALLNSSVRLGIDDHRKRPKADPDGAREAVVRAYEEYLDSQTHYRSNRHIVRTFADAGFEARIAMDDHRLVRPHGPLPRWIAQLALSRLVTPHLELTAR